MEGFFKIQRKFFKHWLWDEKRQFSRAEAFLDLLQSASFKDTKRVINSDVFFIKQGQLIASIRYLATRWGWGRDKVARFMNTLEADNMISRESVLAAQQPSSNRATTAQKVGHGQVVLTISNYARYASSSDTDQPLTIPPTSHPPATDTAQVEEVKKVKKVKNKSLCPPTDGKMIWKTRINKLYKRRESTQWNDKETRAFNKLTITEEDMELIEAFCDPVKGSKYRRKDIFTLLNNWNGEVDRARDYSSTATVPTATPQHANPADNYKY